MKTKHFYILVLLSLIMWANADVQAQRRTVVVRRPARTVVVTRVPNNQVVYVNRHPARDRPDPPFTPGNNNRCPWEDKVLLSCRKLLRYEKRRICNHSPPCRYSD